MSSSRITRRTFGGLLASVPFLTAAQAQEAYPTKAVNIVLPFAAGGASDFVSRSLAERLSPLLGQPVIVENRPGANGIIGTSMVAQAAPDGYTLLLALGATLSINPSLYKATNYNPVVDFTPIGLFVKQPYLIAVSPTLGVKNIDELVKLAKERGDGKLTFATGSASHQLAGLLLQKETGIKLTHVPYNSTSLAMPDVISGRVDIIILAAFTALPFIGQIVPLAATSAQRASVLPDVPTMVELGYPKYVVEGWYGLAGPAGLPADVVTKVNEASVKVFSDPAVIQAFKEKGLDATTSTPEEFGAFIKSELELWTSVIKGAGIEPQ